METKSNNCTASKKLYRNRRLVVLIGVRAAIRFQRTPFFLDQLLTNYIINNGNFEI